MKKIIALLLVLVMVIGLVACGGKKDDKLTIDGTEMTAEIEGKKLTLTDIDGDFWEGSGLEDPIVLKRAD